LIKADRAQEGIGRIKSTYARIRPQPEVLAEQTHEALKNLVKSKNIRSFINEVNDCIPDSAAEKLGKQLSIGVLHVIARVLTEYPHVLGEAGRTAGPTLKKSILGTANDSDQDVIWARTFFERALKEQLGIRILSHEDKPLHGSGPSSSGSQASYGSLGEEGRKMKATLLAAERLTTPDQHHVFTAKKKCCVIL
ncbi:MAG: hypothetical protein ACOYKZ_05235, partial [Chlamydiia bacterium]